MTDWESLSTFRDKSSAEVMDISRSTRTSESKNLVTVVFLFSLV